MAHESGRTWDCWMVLDMTTSEGSSRARCSLRASASWVLYCHSWVKPIFSVMHWLSNIHYIHYSLTRNKITSTLRIHAKQSKMWPSSVPPTDCICATHSESHSLFEVVTAVSFAHWSPSWNSTQPQPRWLRWWGPASDTRFSDSTRHNDRLLINLHVNSCWPITCFCCLCVGSWHTRVIQTVSFTSSLLPSRFTWHIGFSLHLSPWWQPITPIYNHTWTKIKMKACGKALD